VLGRREVAEPGYRIGMSYVERYAAALRVCELGLVGRWDEWMEGGAGRVVDRGGAAAECSNDCHASFANVASPSKEVEEQTASAVWVVANAPTPTKVHPTI
jgi:hypothetical protein